MRLRAVIISFFITASLSHAQSILDSPPRQMSKEQRREMTDSLERKALSMRSKARATALSQGWSYRGETNGMYFELDSIVGGKVYMDASDNRDAGITAASDQIRDLPFELTGTGMVVGVWEAGGLILSNHQEYVGRVIHKDTDSISSHATHVAGTLAAVGISNRAAGMAPGVIIDSRNSSLDEAEMAAVGKAHPGETNVIQISSHSYSTLSGWENGYTPWRWYGLWPTNESDNFGIYEFQTREWDVIAYAAPYYLIFKSAGNNRDETAPTNGQFFQYFDGTWMTGVYNSAIHPPDDGWDNGGYDTLTPKANAKNIMTVGAVKDAETGGGPRDISLATMTTFSGWGPTDDGRIKPDIVANGQSVYSCDDDHVMDYATRSGTSMSTPSTAGSAVLLLDLYGQLFTNCLLSSTMKGLLLHTADDLGRVGPDYINGWGLLNVRNAAEHIVAHYHNTNGQRIVEDILTDAERTNMYTFTGLSNGTVRVTLCWTDPPGSILAGVDNTNLTLVNDLDLTVSSPDGTEYFPWVLDPMNPTNPATTGTNIRDNVEQVCLTNEASNGVWTVIVESDDTMTDSEQTYSLFITGHDDSVDSHVQFVAAPRYEGGRAIQWNSHTNETYVVTRATNLLTTAPFSTSLGTITGNYLSTTFTDTTATADSPYFYKVDPL